MDTENLVLSKCGKSFHYNRSASTSSKKLESILSKRYNTEQCVVVPSGMSAINNVLQSIILNSSEQINLFYGNELYCDTPSLIKYFEKIIPNQIKVNVNKPLTIIKKFEKQYANQHNVLLFESCSNPRGYIFDFSIIDTLRKLSKSLCVIVDNTWLTDVIFNPFEYGANIVVTSLTKYYSGGQAMGGAILGASEIIEPIRKYVSRTGVHTSPYNIDIIIKNIDEMENHIIKSSKLTCRTIFIQNRNQIIGMFLLIFK